MTRQKLLLLADETRHNDFLSRPIPEAYVTIAIDDHHEITNHPDAKSIFILKDFEPGLLPDTGNLLQTPVFINSIPATFDSNQLNACWVRVNAWPGFFRNPILEISSPLEDITAAENILHDLRWPYKRVTDQPGMFTPRVIAMIINEACYAIQEKISTKKDIDTAMKLGTNYPFGPFEWADRIGIENIRTLLLALSKTDKRYEPATDLLHILQSPA